MTFKRRFAIIAGMLLLLLILALPVFAQDGGGEVAPDATLPATLPELLALLGSPVLLGAFLSQILEKEPFGLWEKVPGMWKPTIILILSALGGPLATTITAIIPAESMAETGRWYVFVYGGVAFFLTTQLWHQLVNRFLGGRERYTPQIMEL